MEEKSSYDALESFSNGVKFYLSQKGVRDYTKFKAHISHDKFVIYEWNYPFDKPKPDEIPLTPIPPKIKIQAPKVHDFGYIIVIGPAGKDPPFYKTTIYDIRFDFEIKLEQISIQLTMFQNMQTEFHPLHDDIICNIGKLIYGLIRKLFK